MAGKKVIDKMGGVNAASKMLDRAYTTVREWWLNDVIPSTEQATVFECARRNKKKVKHADFF